MKTTLLLTLPQLFFFCFANAQVQWTPLDGPTGVTIHTIVATDSDELVMWTGGNRMLKSVDKGETWFDINDGLPETPFLFIKHLIAGTNGMVYFVCDDYIGNEGAQLFRLDPDTEVWEYLGEDGVGNFSINPDGHLYLTRENNLWRSTNEGNSFNLINTNVLTYNAYLFTLGDNQNYNYSFSSETMFKFNDNGTGMTQIDYPGSYHLNDIEKHPSGNVFIANHGLYKSANGINNWVQVGFGTLADSNEFVDEILILPSGRLFANMDTKVIFSDDEGETWSQLENPIFGHSYLANSTNDLYYFRGGCFTNSFLRSLDGGQNWTSLRDNFKAPSVSSIKTDHANNLYITSCRDVYVERSTDGGSTWAPLKITSANYDVENIWVAGNGDIFALSRLPYRIQRSTDSGLTWEELSLPNAGSETQLIFSPQGEIYSFNQGTYHKSIDNGNTWLDVTAMFPPNFTWLMAMAVHPNGAIFVSLEMPWGGGIFRSYDGGQSWQDILTNFNGLDFFHVTSKGHIYFSGYNTSGLYVSFDNLETYQLVLPDENGVGPVVSNIAGDVFAITENEVVMTNDDGQTWTTITNGLYRPRQSTTLQIDREQHLLIGNDGDVIYRTAEPTVDANLVSGYVWLDEVEDCISDGAESPLHQWLVKADGIATYLCSTGYDGHYLLPLPSGDYDLNVVLPSQLWELGCNNNVPLSFQAGMESDTVDFPVQVVEYCPALQVDVSTPFLRRCFENKYSVHYCNEGTEKAEGATIEITLDSFMIFQTATANLLSQNGQTLIFDIGEIGVFDCGDFEVFVMLPCSAPLGMEHCVQAKIFPDDCTVISNQPALECQINIGSFDPNEKRAFAEGKEKDEWVLPDTDLEFQIRFQNTGTDTAFNVRLEDRLSFFLDPSTVVPGASSHPYTWSLDNNILNFYFENIMLPDSNINEPASHGFIKFRVSQKQNVTLGNHIANSAKIFFDANEPVVTNEVILRVGELVGMHETPVLVKSMKLEVYPNPFLDITTIHLSGTESQSFEYSLFNAFGQRAGQGSFIGTDFQLDGKMLSPGLYFMMIKSHRGDIATGKVILQQ